MTAFVPETVPVALQYLITGDVFRWGLIMAGSVVAAVPVMVLYYLAQRFVVQGLAAGAVASLGRARRSAAGDPAV